MSLQIVIGSNEEEIQIIENIKNILEDVSVSIYKNNESDNVQYTFHNMHKHYLNLVDVTNALDWIKGIHLLLTDPNAIIYAHAVEEEISDA
jgi:hypothetical protein